MRTKTIEFEIYDVGDIVHIIGTKSGDDRRVRIDTDAIVIGVLDTKYSGITYTFLLQTQKVKKLTAKDEMTYTYIGRNEGIAKFFGAEEEEQEAEQEAEQKTEEQEMNKVDLIGRLTRDPDVRYTQGDGSMAIARYTIAVDRRRSKNRAAQVGQEEQTADFISCVAFGKAGEFAEKYLHKGIKIAVSGRIQTGNYTNKDGQKVYTTDVVVEDQEFVESIANGMMNENPAASAPKQESAPAEPNVPTFNSAKEGGFVNIPDGIDEELPFQ